MSSNKKSTIPQPFKKYPEVQPKYQIDQKVFTVTYHKGKPEELLEVKIRTRSSREIAIKDTAGKILTTKTAFSYYVVKPDGFTEDIHEVQLYPNYTEGAKAFAKGFLKLIQ
jgi:hypothetical protein